MNRHMVDSERQLCIRGGFSHFMGTVFPGFPFPVILICLVVSLHLLYLRNLPLMGTHLLAKMDSNEEAYG